MSIETENREGALKKLAVPVIVVVALLLGVVLYMGCVELFSFGALSGTRPTAKVQDVPVVDTIDNHLLKMPVLREQGNRMLQQEADPNAGPQAVWRSTATLWGILMIVSSFLFLLIKRFVETTEDETTVMHLKGDTDTALRAKGGRG